MRFARHTLIATLILASACKSKEEAKPQEAPSRDAVELAKAVVERSGIRWTKAERRHLARTISAPAEVEFDPDRTAHVGPLSEGRIARVAVKVGARVERRAALAVLSSVAGAESRASLTQAQANLELARTNLRRQEELHASGIDTERVHQEAVAVVRRAEAELEAARQRAGLTGDLTLRSPLAGTVVERNATAGETVGPASKLFTIADLSRVWVVGRVYERDVGAVREGATARLTLDAYPGRSWEGSLVYVAGALDHETRTLPVRIELENADSALRPGLFGTLAIEAGDAVEALAVESGAVQRLGARTIVFVHQDSAGEKERFAVRELHVGRAFGTFLEVTSGLQPGEEVVTAGGFTLKSELLRDTLAEED
jgi:cobalt-zinc-cadmium efflux system membrane fusion protein